MIYRFIHECHTQAWTCGVGHVTKFQHLDTRIALCMIYVYLTHIDLYIGCNSHMEEAKSKKNHKIFSL